MPLQVITIPFFRQRYPRWTVFGTAGAVLALLATMLWGLNGRNDLDVFLAATNDLLAGRSAYSATYFDGYHYYYGTTFAILLSPLALLPASLAKLAWGLLMASATARCIWLVFTHWLPTGLSSTERAAILSIALLVLFQSMRDNINAGQVTPLVLWLCMEGVTRLGTGSVISGALLIAFGIDLKILPLVLVPWMVYRAHWRALAVCVGAVVALQFLPSLVLGWQHNLDLLAARWELVRPTNLDHVLDEEEPSFIALSSVLTAFFSTEGHNPHTLQLPRLVMALSAETLAAWLLAGRLVIVAAALWFLRWRTMFRRTTAQHTWWEFAYLTLCSVLLFPHQRHYSMLMALPAILLLCTYTIAVPALRAGRIWLGLCALAFVGMSCDLLFGAYADLFMHYKLLSFMVLLLLGMLAWCNPQRLEQAVEDRSHRIVPL